ncbi:MAG: glycosyltransferase family 2 protein, partial [Lachnospiraceae bacterium]|nr:glycosyltransferase family 2 protein [Lachnospiraceae bacterium]
MSAIVESVKGNGGSFPAGIAVIIPAFDPDERLVEMIRRLCSMGAKDIIVMNDGSCENCMRRFSLVEKQFGVVVLSHPLNRGKGAALKTGMRYLLTNIPEVIGCVTADADGQHTPDDIARVALRLKENRECLILGSREFSGKKVPWKSCAGNKITSVVFRLQT